MGILLLVAQIGQIQILDKALSRGFDRLMTMIENTDKDEYIDKRRDVTDMIELSERVLQPLYSVLVQYIGPLAATYDELPPGDQKSRV